MNKTIYKILFFVFALLSYGSLRELFRILTSNAPDIAVRRGTLTVISLTLTIFIIYLMRYFWNKAKE